MVFNERLTKVVERYLKKGPKVFVEGELQTRKWQNQSGQDRYSTEVVLQRFRGDLQLLDTRGQGGGGAGRLFRRQSLGSEFGPIRPHRQPGALPRNGGGKWRKLLARTGRRNSVLRADFLRS